MFATPQPLVMLNIVLLASLMSVICASRLDQRETLDDYLNVCLRGNNHKATPGPESKLLSHCVPWRSRSCCTENTTHRIHTEKKFLNFAWDHCKELSLPCRQYFIQDLCFYECSPNVGPWLVEDVRKIREERFANVPLCASQCVQWWDACKDDFTCVDNWAEKFNWSSGINTCPAGSQCRPFDQVFDGATHFCENLFGNSFKVVPEKPGECFYLWFDPNDANPNDEVAEKKAKALIGCGSGFTSNVFVMILALCLFSLIRL